MQWTTTDINKTHICQVVLQDSSGIKAESDGPSLMYFQHLIRCLFAAHDEARAEAAAAPLVGQIEDMLVNTAEGQLSLERAFAWAVLTR